MCDVLIIAETLVAPRIVNVEALHLPLADDGGSVIKKSLTALRAEGFSSVRVGITYAALCHGDDPNKNTLDRCSMFLGQSLLTANGYAPRERPLVVVPLGADAAKAIGIKTPSLKAVQSRVLPVTSHGISFTAIPTFSAKQLSTMAGIYGLFMNDLKRAFELSQADTVQAKTIEELTAQYIFPKTSAEVIELCKYITNYAPEGKDPATWAISVDTETTSLFAHRKSLRVLAVSVAWDHAKATAFPLWHKDCPYDVMEVLPAVRALLRTKKPKIMFNGKYDLKVGENAQIEIESFLWDAMLGEHILSEDKKGQYDLKSLTRAYFPEFAPYADKIHEMMVKSEGDTQLHNVRKRKTEEEKALLKEAKRKRKKEGKFGENAFESVPLDVLMLYAAVDADMTRRTAIVQREKARAEQIRLDNKRKTLEKDPYRRFDVQRLCPVPTPTSWLMQNVALPAAKTLARMEYHGVPVDRPYLDSLTAKLTEVIRTSEDTLYQMVGRPDFALKSTRAVGGLLFSEGYLHPETHERVSYMPISYTKTGQAQVTEKVLQQLVLRHKCSFSAQLLVNRKAVKARDTFLANVSALSADDGRMHTNFNIHGTATGRLSSNDENLQNIPKMLAGCNIKKIFVPTDDSYVFVNCDAKAAEVRILTAYSRDAALIKTLNDGIDSHAFIASTVIELVRRGDSPDEVLRSMGLDPQYAYTLEDFEQRKKYKDSNRAYYDILDLFRTAVKRVLFGVLYGAGARKIAETIGISFEQATTLIQMIFKQFPSIPKYVESTHWELEQFGMVETYFGRRRRLDMRGATPMLRNKAKRQAVNFKIQSTSNEIVLRRMTALEDPLRQDLGGQLLLTVHDSIGFQVPKKYITQLPDFLYEHLEKGAARDCPWLPVAFKWDFELGPSYGELSAYDDYMKKNAPEQESLLQQAYTEEEIKTTLSSVEEVAA